MGWRATFLIAALVFGLGLSAQAKKASPKVAPSALKQMQVLKTIKGAKSPIQNKIESRLYLGLQNLQDPQLKGSLPDFRFVKNDVDGRVPVDIVLVDAAGLNPVVKKLTSLGEIVRGKNGKFQRISARVRLENLETIAAMSEVRRIRQAIPFLKGVVNTSEGDKTHGAEAARALYGATGAGVKIGVLSDGVDSLAALQASGDLPASVQVLPGQAGSGDEGSAMLEIVHDLAPGASLAFATAGPDEAQFAQNILDLATAGCTIIVDDVIYLDESPFQDGPVAQAVNTVTTAGVLYFSSAGNEGNVNDLTSGTWEGDFLSSAAADPAPLAGANLHDFGDGGNSILVEFGGGNPPLLIWAEQYDLATGSASTDFDIYDMDGGLTTIFDASTDVQDGAGGDDFPIEYIGGGTFGGERLLIDKFAAGSTSSVPMFNLIVFRGELDDNVVTPGATRGHSAAAAAFSVAATPAAASFDGITPDGPYPGLFTSANESESFTSDGPRRIVLTPTGVEITPGNRTSTGGVTRQKPDITAADGVSTAAPGFNPFYGTSAAAPHAAAIAALIKSALPAINPGQVRTALVSSAIDIETPGTDRDTGAGIVMANLALAAAGAVPAANVTGTKTVAGTFSSGNLVTYTITLTNSGATQADNTGNEFVDILPSSLTLVSANASSGTPTATIGTNTVTWDGSIAAAGSVTITITATINNVPGGTIVSNQGTINYDGDGNASNEASRLTDDPGLGGASDQTSFTVVGAVVTSTKTASAGPYNVGGNIVYTITLSNSGNATAGDNLGNEFTDVLPAGLTLVSANASSGTAVATVGTNTVTWNGSIPSAGSVTITINATINANAAGTTVNNQGTTNTDSNNDGNNDASGVTDDPAVGGPANPTGIAVAGAANDTVSKTVTGSFTTGGDITYTVVITNSGDAASADNAGNEITDVLPASLTLVSASATSGTAVATIGTNTVTWNGSVPASGSVTITIHATVEAGHEGETISNTATLLYDADGNGTNETTATDSVSFDVTLPIPAVSTLGLILLALVMAAVAFKALRG